MLQKSQLLKDPDEETSRQGKEQNKTLRWK